jgi:hypothetical protein
MNLVENNTTEPQVWAFNIILDVLIDIIVLKDFIKVVVSPFQKKLYHVRMLINVILPYAYYFYNLYLRFLSTSVGTPKITPNTLE